MLQLKPVEVLELEPDALDIRLFGGRPSYEKIVLKPTKSTNREVRFANIQFIR